MQVVRQAERKRMLCMREHGMQDWRAVLLLCLLPPMMQTHIPSTPENRCLISICNFFPSSKKPSSLTIVSSLHRSKSPFPETGIMIRRRARVRRALLLQSEACIKSDVRMSRRMVDDVCMLFLPPSSSLAPALMSVFLPLSQSWHLHSLIRPDSRESELMFEAPVRVCDGK